MGNIYFNRKPRKCPNCGHSPVANVLYGMPIDSPELDAEIEAGKTVLGGCIISPDSPRWHCTSCNTDFYKLGNKETEFYDN